MKYSRFFILKLTSFITLAFFLLHTTKAEDVVSLDAFNVIGSKENIQSLTGSGFYLDYENLNNLQYTNIDQILKQTPGVYLRGEDGYGLFPNISLRGVDTTRSSKVTIMEDGILSAPAPYAAPSAYYSPTAGRMHAIEILKGSSQIQYGPHTTGGVINYISTPIPEMNQGMAKVQYGSDDELRFHSWYGGKVDTPNGKWGYLLEWHHQETDGFKDLDGGADTGFEKGDIMAKVSWEPNWNKPNYFEFKAGYSDLHADETYLGLSSQDFNDDPLRRYINSQFDEIDTNQSRFYLRHIIELNPSVKLTSTAYYNKFHRDWYKIHSVQDVDDLDGDASTTDFISLSNALFNNLGSYGILTGSNDGQFRLRSNNRDYWAAGFQTKLDWSFATAETEHDLQVGLRLHRDRIRRFQRDDTFSQVGGAITSISTGGEGDAGNRRQEVTAFALHALDRIQWGKWAFIPGIRYENIQNDFKQFQQGSTLESPTEMSSLDIFAPGISFEYLWNENWKSFGGYHRGFSTPSPRGATLRDLDEERSDSFELGLRYDNNKGLLAEAVLFYTLFDDLLVNDNIGGGGGSVTENVGEVTSYGAELLMGVDLGAMNQWAFNMPVTLAFTYTNAEFDGDSLSEDPESIFAGAEDGNEVPYIPELQVNFSAGMEFEKFRTYLNVNWVDERHASGSNSSAEINPVGLADARFGKLDRFITVDLSAYYKLTETVEIFTTVQNVLDEEYVTSRVPHGPRPGAPTLASVGVQVYF